VYTCILHHFQGWVKLQKKQYLDVNLAQGYIKSDKNKYTINALDEVRYYPPVLPASVNNITQCTSQLNRLLIILSLSSPITTIWTEPDKRELMTESRSISLESSASICCACDFKSKNQVKIFSKYLLQINHVLIMANRVAVSFKGETISFHLEIGSAQSITFQNTNIKKTTT
jgi:hypothetical protein